MRLNEPSDYATLVIAEAFKRLAERMAQSRLDDAAIFALEQSAIDEIRALPLGDRAQSAMNEGITIARFRFESFRRDRRRAVGAC